MIKKALQVLVINKGNHHGIVNVEIELNNTLNKSQIEFDYYNQKDNNC